MKSSKYENPNNDSDQPALAEIRHKNPAITRPENAESLLNSRVEKPKEFVEGLLGPGLTLLGAASKTSKTRFGLYLAGILSQESDAFETMGSQQSRVLYQLLSEDTRRLKERAIDLQNSEVGFNSFNLEFLSSEEYIGLSYPSRARAYIQKRKIDVLFIDTFADILEIQMRGNRRKEIQLAEQLRKLANDTGTAIVAIHQSNKSDLEENLFQARNLEAAADNVLLISSVFQDNGKEILILKHYGRDYPKKTLYMESTEGGIGFKQLDKIPVLEKEIEIVEKLHILNSHGVSQRNQAKVLGFTQGYVSKLHKKHEIASESTEVYTFDDIEELVLQDDEEDTDSDAERHKDEQETSDSDAE